MKKFEILLTFLLLYLCSIESDPSSFRLVDVDYLFFKSDEYTTSLRNESMKKLMCIGENKKRDCVFYVDFAMCYIIESNNATKSLPTKWKCIADLPSGVKFDRMIVSCERDLTDKTGEMVVNGSCLLKYTTVNVAPSSSSSSTTTTTANRPCMFMIVLFFFIVSLSILYQKWKRKYTNHHQRNRLSQIGTSGYPHFSHYRPYIGYRRHYENDDDDCFNEYSGDDLQTTSGIAENELR